MGVITYKHDIFSRHNQSNRWQWYDLNDYHQVYIAWRGYGGNDGIFDYQGLRLWMIETLAGEIIIDDEKTGNLGNSVFLYFSSEADVLLFKLSHWGAQVLEWNDK